MAHEKGDLVADDACHAPKAKFARAQLQGAALAIVMAGLEH